MSRVANACSAILFDFLRYCASCTEYHVARLVGDVANLVWRQCVHVSRLLGVSFFVGCVLVYRIPSKNVYPFVIIDLYRLRNFSFGLVDTTNCFKDTHTHII